MNRRKLLTLSAASLIASPAILRACPAKAAPPAVIDSDIWWSGSIFINPPNQNIWYAIRRCVLSDLQQGEVLHATGQVAVRNDTGWNVELAVALALVPTNTPVGYYTDHGFGGTVFSGVNGANITPGNHYGSPIKSRARIVQNNMQNAALILCVRARCSESNGSPALIHLNTLTELSVMRFAL